LFCLKLGIFLNLIGTFLVAFCFGENLEGAYQTTKKGRKVYMASFLHPCWFKALPVSLLLMRYLLGFSGFLVLGQEVPTGQSAAVHGDDLAGVLPSPSFINLSLYRLPPPPLVAESS
jgi:hypothetical protein